MAPFWLEVLACCHDVVGVLRLGCNHIERGVRCCEAQGAWPEEGVAPGLHGDAMRRWQGTGVMTA